MQYWKIRFNYEVARATPRFPFLVIQGTITVQHNSDDFTTYLGWTTQFSKESDRLLQEMLDKSAEAKK